MNEYLRKKNRRVDENSFPIKKTPLLVFVCPKGLPKKVVELFSHLNIKILVFTSPEMIAVDRSVKVSETTIFPSTITIQPPWQRYLVPVAIAAGTFARFRLLTLLISGWSH